MGAGDAASSMALEQTSGKVMPPLRGAWRLHFADAGVTEMAGGSRNSLRQGLDLLCMFHPVNVMDLG